MSACSRNLVLTIAALLAWAPSASAQRDTTRTTDKTDKKKTVEEIDRQIDQPKDESSPNTQLWEEYQRYKHDEADGDKVSGERVNFGADVTVAEGASGAGGLGLGFACGGGVGLGVGVGAVVVCSGASCGTVACGGSCP